MPKSDPYTIERDNKNSVWDITVQHTTYPREWEPGTVGIFLHNKKTGSSPNMALSPYEVDQLITALKYFQLEALEEE